MIRKKKSTFKKMKVPGEIFFKHINYGLPELPGIYCCYYKPEQSSGWCDVFPTAGMKIINFSDGKFFGNVHVLAWIGPLPVLSLDELEIKKECISRVFYTGTLKDGIKNKFKTGPHSQYMIAYLKNGRKGEFIFEVNTHKSIPNPIARFNLKIERWKKIKDKDIKKYIKIMKKFKEK